jgi:hypothetical protein
VPTTLYFHAVQIHTLVIDFLILLAPLFILRHLHISWQQRALLVMVVGFGGMWVDSLLPSSLRLPEVVTMSRRLTFLRSSLLQGLYLRRSTSTSPPPVLDFARQDLGLLLQRNLRRNRTELGYRLRMRRHAQTAIPSMAVAYRGRDGAVVGAAGRATGAAAPNRRSRSYLDVDNGRAHVCTASDQRRGAGLGIHTYGQGRGDRGEKGRQLHEFRNGERASQPRGYGKCRQGLEQKLTQRTLRRGGHS